MERPQKDSQASVMEESGADQISPLSSYLQ